VAASGLISSRVGELLAAHSNIFLFELCKLLTFCVL
jgi:hypothetical protein